MRGNLLLALIVSLFFGYNGHAQEADKNSAVYRRSSLCLILMDEAQMPKRDVIKAAFIGAPMPDKYNDHNVWERCFSPDTLKITEADKAAYQAAVAAGVKAESDAAAKNSGDESGDAPKKKSGGGFGKAMGGFGKAMASSATGGVVDAADKSGYAIRAHKFLMEHYVAKQMFDKWFKDSLGNFSMGLIQERGMYDASAMDVATAKSTKRGMGLLEDAGEELINNTFVVVSRYRYLSKNELCKEIDEMAQAVTQNLGSYASLGAKAAMLAVKASMGAGYYVQTTSFLFQLTWNQDIADKFYGELWSDPEAYEKADIFSVKMIGQETAWANVKAGIFTNKSEEELIQGATVNAMDAVLAKLAKKYEVFKTKTPLYSVDPEALAQIGMKEGLESGDKFEVLEQMVNPETNKTTYKRKATLKVCKGQIWDNRYMADEERALNGEQQEFTATRFEGNLNGLYPGMLLRQIK